MVFVRISRILFNIAIYAFNQYVFNCELSALQTHIVSLSTSRESNLAHFTGVSKKTIGFA